MSKYIQQQILYPVRTDDIATIARALDQLREKDYEAAARTLVVYLHFLQDDQKPRLVNYDPRAEIQ